MQVLSTLVERIEAAELRLGDEAPGLECPEVDPPEGATFETLLCLLERRVDLLECQLQVIEDHPQPGPDRDKALELCCEAYTNGANECIEAAGG